MEMDVGHRRGRHPGNRKITYSLDEAFRMQEQGDSRCLESQYTDYRTCQSPAVSEDHGTS